MDDVRTLAAVERRRRWAARQVRHAQFRRQCTMAGAAFGASARDVSDAIRRFAAAYGDLDLTIEIDRMWEDA